MAYGYTTSKTFTVKPTTSFPDVPDIGASKAEFLASEPVVLLWTKQYDYYGVELGVDVVLSKSSTLAPAAFSVVKAKGGSVSAGLLAAGTYYYVCRWNPDSIAAAQAVPPAV